ncbi:DUF2780 domain-containing protein [Veronia pacifica]|uniref:DUF2780 domain-containing protein n=1 Tax=Veronia pacifica TaxID=1080227 RepID=A0A1C3ERV7_9GAMM|nr:DUF2780 domain-containing protein [Veronia pacifica]ODA35951.1 hypothetical protein A8L45_02680 [Veronia pacifica]
MKQPSLSLLLAASLLSVCTTASAFNMSDLMGEKDKSEQQAAANPLVDMLTQKLGINSKQAAGGAGAMLTQALGQLSDKNSNELNTLIPGMDGLTGGLPAGLGSMLNSSGLSGGSDVTKMFSSLGLDPALISQFAPVIMKFLGEKGASSALLGELKNIWQ